MAAKTAFTTETELYKQIRAGDFKPCYFFYGKDVAALERAVKTLVNKLVPQESRDLNYHFFRGGEFNASELGDVIASLPMFAERLVAAVNDLNADSVRADDLKYIRSVISEIDRETATVIIYATGVDLCGGKKSLTDKNQKLAEHIVKCGGAVVEFAYKKPQELVKYIQSQVESRGAHISYGAALSIAEGCLANVLMINNEIEKLCAYRAGGEISEQDVSDLVSGQLDTDAYKLARAVTYGDSGAAFAILTELYSRQQESLALLNTIGGAFLDLYRAKLAMLHGRSERDAAEDFGYKSREFAIKKAMSDCSRIPIEKLRYCLQVLSDCDIDMKSKRTDSRILLEEAMTRMMNYSSR